MKQFYPYLKPNYNTKNGEIPIYVRYNYNRVKRTLIPINYSIAYDHWDFKKNWIKNACPDYEKINDALVELTSRLGNILTEAKENELEPTIDYVLLELAKKKEYDTKTKRIDLFAQLDKYIEEQKTKVVNDVIKDYKTLKKHLNGFKDHSSQRIAFSNLNITFYNEFVDYLNYTAKKRDETIGLSNNTVGKQIKNLKAFVHDRIEKRVIPFIDTKPFKRIMEEVDHIYLSEEEIKQIYDLDLSDNPELEKIRDIFIVGCYTGLRYGDLSNLCSVHIDMEQEIIKLSQRKVHRPVIIPLIDYVPEILKKYDLQLPEVTLNDFNVGVKKLGEKAGIVKPCEIIRYKGKKAIKEVKKKHELISSHTCRRSFCTNMYLSGFPAEELMKISGHKSTSAFLLYIKIDNLQVAHRLKKLRSQVHN